MSGKVLDHMSNPSCVKEAIYKQQNSIFIFYINTFKENNSLKSVLMAVSHASDW